ncbi:tetratricopeptide repeat protein 33-like [Liolophura sinensis]|uniref:tetratricopeptide repeat protein 33-like n=1 Tax=Liolophura sinensis TaxID=3198878 RepID=UPI003158DC40
MSTAGWKFGWKRKISSKVSADASVAFSTDAKDQQEDFNNEDIDWLSATKSRKLACLEDADAKSNRLKDEGTLLAESERYWEAIKKWDEALQYSPKNAKILEMKAQALMILCEVFPAVKTARQVVELSPNWWVGHQTLGRTQLNLGEVSARLVVKLSPNWWVGHQTLGRTQLNLGEVRQAVISFSKAVHLNPVNSELWKEDLLWACSLLTRKINCLDPEKTPIQSLVKGATVTELDTTNSLIENSCDSVAEEANVVSSYVSDPSHLQQDVQRSLKTLPANYVLMRD